jgi:uncharacterized protein YjiS (DUF1127 family)
MCPQQMPAQPTLMRLPAPVRWQAVVLKYCYGIAGAIGGWSIRTGDTLLLWLERYRQRRALGSMSDHLLKDLGLSRSDAGRETGKRFWEG